MNIPLTGAGEMATRIRGFDWAATPFGPVEQWPASLRSVAWVVLENRFPMALWWGQDLRHLYNDACVPVLAGKHPGALARPAAEVWAEIWHILGPQARQVMDGGGATWNEHLLLPVQRRGFLEETFFTFSFSPVRNDEGGIGGVLVTCQETTRQVQDERQLRMLRELAAGAAGDRFVEEACRHSAAVLGRNPADVPFALLYLLDDAGGTARRVATAGFTDDDGPATPATLPMEAGQGAWPLAQARDHDGALVIDVPAAVCPLPGGYWNRAPERAVIVPLIPAAGTAPYGFLVAGVSPLRALDDGYLQLFRLAGDQVTAALAGVYAFQAERRRAEELVALEVMARPGGHLRLAQATRERAQLVAREQQAVREAQLQKQQLHALFMQAPAAIAILRGPECVIELANLDACRIWGRQQRDVINRPLFEAMPELREQAWKRMLDDVYRSGEAVVGREIPVHLDVRGDGSLQTVYLNFVYTPLKSPLDEVDGILVIALDVTDQVTLRRDLARFREEAEAASRAKDEFLAVLGHELRNPLAPIRTALQLLKLRRIDAIGQETAIIDRQVAHLVRLVDDLLDVSRITQGKIELHRERVEIAEVLTRAIEMASPLLEQRRHTLGVDVARSGLCVQGDPARLAQVFSNLLTNAAKYTAPQGEITLSARAEADEVVVRVRDNGAGLQPGMVDRIFDTFVQEHQARERPEGGLGLGLAIVRSLVGLHGGSVSATSEGRGRGSEFTVRLPRAAALAREDVERGAEHWQMLAQEVRGRVLVVDDNEDGALMLTQLLSMFGYTTRHAPDGPSALELAESFDPDIALLDIGLPVMDGYELARRFAAHPQLARTRLVAVTGYGQEQDRQQAVSAGFKAHLVKPVDMDELSATLERIGAEPAAGGDLRAAT